MLDELLGRAVLKEEIAELESTVNRLERQLESEQDRRVAAVRDRQESDEQVNRLEDRIADLEGQLDQVQNNEPPIQYRCTERLKRTRITEVLDWVASYRTSPEDALTAMVTETTPRVLESAFPDRLSLIDRAAPCVVITDDAGIVSAALAPPLPPSPFVEWNDRFVVDEAWFLPTGAFSMALIRSDLFAYGEYDGSEQTHYKGFESPVMGTHSKGGFSQARFDRRRDEAIDTHLDQCREVLDERETVASESLIVVGERSIITEFSDRAVQVTPVSATGNPEPALADAFEAFWTTTLYGL